MTRTEQHLKALEFFKDWSNYLLVTTVAAVGWVASKDAAVADWAKPWCLAAFGLSTVFAIMTLAVIPLVGEQLTDTTTSFYDVKPSVNLLWLWPPEIGVKVKAVCWPQHIFFLVGVILYVLGNIIRTSMPATGA